MNVIKIVVDELQENCKECIFNYKDGFGHMWCKPIQYKISGLSPFGGVPSWCPLVVEDDEECEWVLREFDGRKMYNSPENCGYHATQPEFIYCPSCGKRIKYVEE